MTRLWLWRHPRCAQAAGRCIGRTDLPVDPRRAKRLAHRVRALARGEGLPREVWTSPLARCRDVGAWLRRWGWRHRVDARLSELDFGRWDGLPWTAIAHDEVAAWEADFVGHAPGGGETLRALLERVQGFLLEHAGRDALLVVAHAGWMQALRWHLGERAAPSAARWPAAPRHGALLRLEWR
jgi:alpha-ribazole phosphatase